MGQRVAYGDLGSQNPAPITPAYERKADPVIELQLEKAGVRLAYLLDVYLIVSAARQQPDHGGRGFVATGAATSR
jgi:hypothetical protein